MGRREIHDLARAAGRDPESLIMSARVEVEVSPGPSSERAANRARLSGVDSGAMIAGIQAYQTAGVEHIVLALNSGDVDQLKSTMESIADSVLPHFS